MSVFKLAVQFDGNQVCLGYDILRGTQTILFVVGDYSLKPGDEFPIIVRGDVPILAIATAGKVTESPMTPNDEKRIAAIGPSRRCNSNGGIEAEPVTEIRIAGIELLQTDIDTIAAEKYAARKKEGLGPNEE